jgi:uncharacterized protein (TIGR02996 family)
VIAAELLRAVLDEPVSNAPRVAYADAIRAFDPARAELIDVQIRLAEHQALSRDPPDSLHVWCREGTLISEHASRWAGSLGPLVEGIYRSGFRRGFVEHIRIDAAELLRRADELYDAVPILHLRLSGVPAVARELFASPHLARIRSLHVPSDELGDDEAELLAASPHLGELRSLSLYDNRISRRGLEAIAASTSLPELRYFDLQSNPAPDPCPSIGGREADGYVHDMDYPPINLELRERFGPKAWLTATVWHTSRWPFDDGV